MAIDESTRVLVVADWTVEATGVVAECRWRAEADRALFILMVPAWLHGLAWAGDPRAAVPCARRQLATLARLCLDAGRAVEIAGGRSEPDQRDRRRARRAHRDQCPALHSGTTRAGAPA